MAELPTHQMLGSSMSEASIGTAAPSAASTRHSIGSAAGLECSGTTCFSPGRTPVSSQAQPFVPSSARWEQYQRAFSAVAASAQATAVPRRPRRQNRTGTAAQSRLSGSSSEDPNLSPVFYDANSESDFGRGGSSSAMDSAGEVRRLWCWPENDGDDAYSERLQEDVYMMGALLDGRRNVGNQADGAKMPSREPSRTPSPQPWLHETLREEESYQSSSAYESASPRHPMSWADANEDFDIDRSPWSPKKVPESGCSSAWSSCSPRLRRTQEPPPPRELLLNDLSYCGRHSPSLSPLRANHSPSLSPVRGQRSLCPTLTLNSCEADRAMSSGLLPAGSVEDAANVEDLHARGDCRPCAYFFYKEDGCRWGDECSFCHLCPPGEIKRRKKEKMKQLKGLRSRGHSKQEKLGELQLGPSDSVASGTYPV